MPEATNNGERIFRGIPASSGMCRGKIAVLWKERLTIHKRALSDAGVAEEVNRLKRALVQTRHQLLEVQRKVSEAMGAQEAGIFEAHLLMLEDRTLLDEVVGIIQKDKVNAEHAFHNVAERYAERLSRVEDDYLRERATDVRDVTRRVLNNLLGQDPEPHLLKEPCIVISHDLTACDMAQLDRPKVLGFATDLGNKNAHLAIIARSLRIPAVVGLSDASRQLESGQYALLDGSTGVVIVNPTEQTLEDYEQRKRKLVMRQGKIESTPLGPSVTLDGQRIFVSANIEQAIDAEEVKANGAEGVGLFRTEYLFINRGYPPTEEEQYQAYRQAAAALKPLPMVIRTVDLGGDKLLFKLAVPEEMNPFLGCRGIRFCLHEKEMFRQQLRAILRASADGNVRMMYPMISGLEEIIQAKTLVEECKAELRKENVAFNENLEIGAMIETPSAVFIADSLARRLKFFSIGSNDLIQYSLAVDRMNERIAHLYEPTHPAIVRLIRATVEAAHRHKIRVSVCGEMAGDPVLAPLLLGLGVDQLSATPALVLPVKFLIRSLKMTEAKELAEFALNCESAAEILARCQDLACQIAPSLFEEK